MTNAELSLIAELLEHNPKEAELEIMAVAAAHQYDEDMVRERALQRHRQIFCDKPLDQAEVA